jgi:glycosyltransferase involved in cell wall biosynthesis
MRTDKLYDGKSLAHAKAEVESIKNADIIISPSELVASFYEEVLQRPVEVVRPPAYLEVTPNKQALDWLPKSYLLHYAGWLHKRKGTNILLSAFELAVQTRPDIKLVLIGNMTSATRREYSRLFAQYPNCILALPVVDKSTLYGVIQRARAVVLPSLIDNIPNTLIESLLLNASVIVTRDSSLDEVVKGYHKAVIVNPTNVSDLAAEMIRIWERPVNHQGNLTRWIDTTEGSAFEPENALQSHLRSLQLMKP